MDNGILCVSVVLKKNVPTKCIDDLVYDIKKNDLIAFVFLSDSMSADEVPNQDENISALEDKAGDNTSDGRKINVVLSDRVSEEALLPMVNGLKANPIVSNVSLTPLFDIHQIKAAIYAQQIVEGCSQMHKPQHPAWPSNYGINTDVSYVGEMPKGFQLLGYKLG